MTSDELSYECPVNELAIVILFVLFYFKRKDTINP